MESSCRNVRSLPVSHPGERPPRETPCHHRSGDQQPYCTVPCRATEPSAQRFPKTPSPRRETFGRIAGSWTAVTAAFSIGSPPTRLVWWIRLLRLAGDPGLGSGSVSPLGPVPSLHPGSCCLGALDVIAARMGDFCSGPCSFGSPAHQRCESMDEECLLPDSIGRHPSSLWPTSRL